MFDFALLHTPWAATAFAGASEMHEQLFTGDRWPSIVLWNHDNSRPASRLAPRADGATSDDVAKATAVLELTLRGTPFLYYGDEIGARDVPVPWDEIVDPPAKRGGRLVRRLVPWWNRDQARSPMPWGDGPDGGFSAGRPWLRMAPDVATRTVAIRGARSVVRAGHVPPRPVAATEAPGSSDRDVPAPGLASADIYAFVREGEGKSVAVAVNFGRRPVTFRIGTRRQRTRIFDTHQPAGSDAVGQEVSGDDQVTLAPRQAIILRAE